MPTFLAPMLASTGRLTGTLGEWVGESKLDGWRRQVAVGRRHCGRPDPQRARHQRSVAEIGQLARLRTDCVLDGEVIAGAACQPPSTRLSASCGQGQPTRRLTLAAFDVLHVSSTSLLESDYGSRRDILDCLARLSDGALLTVNTFPGDDLDAVLHSCAQLDM